MRSWLRSPCSCVAVVMVTVVLSWAPAAEARVTVTSGSRPSVDYFALGDSVASGHGLSDRGTCRRSSRAYPQKVRAALDERYERVRFHLLACSGATAVADAGAGPRSLRFQVSRALAELTSRPTLVSVTIGINDFSWSDLLVTYLRLRADDAGFEQWRTTVTAEVKRQVKRELRRLLARRNVAVVLTQYLNPVNRSSILFGPPLPCEDPAACYERTERIVHGLNTAFAQVRAELAGRPRLRLARIHEPFHGHESPLPICGTSPPEATETWIQHPGDPSSNSFPAVPPELEAVTGDWRGDCFHPNEAGAQAIADAVDGVALSMGLLRRADRR